VGALKVQEANDVVDDFLRVVQRNSPPETGAKIRWERLTPQDWWEAAEWLDRQSIERILDDNLSRALVNRSKERRPSEQVQAAVFESGDFVALVDRDLRFERLIDRVRLLETVARASV
jgi:hypothetical protein